MRRSSTLPLCLALVLAPAAGAEVNAPAPADRARESAESIPSPKLTEEGSFPWAPRWLVSHILPARPDVQDECVWTGSEPTGDVLAANPLAQAQLEMARQAVEASRAAGTLYHDTTPAPVTPRPLETKRAAAADVAPALPPADPCAGVLPHEEE